MHSQEHSWADERQEVWQFLVCTTKRKYTGSLMEKQTRRTLRFKIPFKHLANMGHDLHQVWVKKADVKPDKEAIYGHCQYP